MKNQVCSQYIFESNNECAIKAIHSDDNSKSSPTVFLSLKGTHAKGTTNNETPSETNEEVIHPEYVSASDVDAGVNKTAEMTKEDNNSTENSSVSSSSPPTILDSSEGGKINHNTEKLVTNAWTILNNFKFSSLENGVRIFLFRCIHWL